MKKFYYFISALTLIFGLSSSMIAQNIDNYKYDHQGKNGLRLVEQTKGNVALDFNISEFQLFSFDYNGEKMQEIEFPGIMIPNDKGLPNLPSISRFVAIPQGAQANVTILSYQKDVIDNVNIAPSLGCQPENAEPDTNYIKDEKVYSKNALYPANIIETSPPLSLRGVDAVTLTVSPIQFNPVTKQIVVYHNIEFEVEFTGGNGQFGDNRLRSPYWDPILQNNILNYNTLPVIDYEARMQKWLRDGDVGYEYLIITPNNDAWAEYAEQLKEFRTRQGILTAVYRLDEMPASSTNEMKTWFHNAYNTWDIPPVAVCLLGDHNMNMTQGIPAETVPHPYDGSCITDNQYADVTGDHLPEMCFSRLVARSASELPVFVGKQIEYEYSNPNMDAESYQNPVTALGWQTERWFQLCSEIVGGYFRLHGKTPQRINKIYQGTPGNLWSTAQNTNTVVNYFGPNGLHYIPATPAELGGWNTGTPQQIVNAINTGTFLVQHRDHGYEEGWGEPAFNSSHVNQLTNVGKLPFIMSINCLTGKFNNNTDCFAETFMRRTYNGENAGCVGIMCPTEVSYSFVNDTYVWGVYDLFQPDFLPDFGPYAENSGNWMPAFGNVAGKYFLAQSSWPYNTGDKDITYQMFTAHCDAFLRLYTQVPQNLNVTHDDKIYEGEGSFHITAPAGSVIALTKNGNTILAVATATGNNQTITFSPQTIGTIVDIVVTKQDYLRYTDQITVESNVPNLHLKNYSITGGNNNGQLDYDETVSFNMTISNIGGIPSGNTTATLSTTSPYVTILINQATFNPIQNGQQQTFNNVFSIHSAPDLPDGVNIPFNLHMVSGEHSWDQQFNVIGNAPHLLITNIFTIHDDDNHNGRIDAGETAKIDFQIKNDGHSTANLTVVTLSTNSHYLNIQESTVNISNISINTTSTATFTVTANSNVPMGEIAIFTINATCNVYTASKSVYTRLNLPIENFESGDFSQFNWIHDSINPWSISNKEPYEGNCCMASCDITNNQKSEISLNIDVLQNDTLEFYVKPSSEINDKLSFYIDDEKIEEWAGNYNWKSFKYVIYAGSHIIKWEFNKDNSVSNYDDCGYVDYIVFPPILRTNCNAGADQDICFDESAQLDGSAFGYVSSLWTTDGDGQFSDATILNPLYTPGPQDIKNGSVVLTLKVVGSTGSEVSDDIEITIFDAPSISLNEASSICFNETFNTSANVNNTQSVKWTTSGDGDFEDTNAVETIYTPGIQDIENGNVTLTLTAKGCGTVEASLLLSIIGAPHIEVAEETMTCGLQPVNISATIENAETILWTTAGDGSFNHTTSADIVYTPGEQDIENGGTVLTIQAEGCSVRDTASVNLIINELPTIEVITTEQTICPGETADIYLNLTGLPPYIITIEGDETEYQVLEDGILHLNINNEITYYTITDITDANGCHITTSNSFIVNLYDMIPPTKPSGDTLIAKDKTPTSTYSVIENQNYDAYKWTIDPADAGTIEGETNKVIVNWNPDFNGNVSISVMGNYSECGLTEPSEVLNVILSMTGIDEHDINTMTIYPNPTNDIINLIIKNFNDAKANITVYDMLGEMVYNQEFTVNENVLDTQIDLNYLSNGTYFLTVKTANNIWRKQIVIKR